MHLLSFHLWVNVNFLVWRGSKVTQTFFFRAFVPRSLRSRAFLCVWEGRLSGCCEWRDVWVVFGGRTGRASHTKEAWRLSANQASAHCDDVKRQADRPELWDTRAASLITVHVDLCLSTLHTIWVSLCLHSHVSVLPSCSLCFVFGSVPPAPLPFTLMS